MKNFKTFFEDFNNWRRTSGAVASDRDINWTGSDPSGFRGDGGKYAGNKMAEVEVKLPKEKRPSTPSERRNRKQRQLRQQKDKTLYKQQKQISNLLWDKR